MVARHGAARIEGPRIFDVMAGLKHGIESSRKDTVMAAATAAKKIHASEITRDSGGDMVLSGVGSQTGRVGSQGGRGGKVGVRFDFKGGFDPEALVKAEGPMQLINNDTSGHVTRSRHVKGKYRRGFIGPTAAGQFKTKRGIGPVLRPVIRIPGVGYRYSARHPGTKGKQTWQKGRKRARPVVTKIIRMHVARTIKRSAGAGA